MQQDAISVENFGNICRQFSYICSLVNVHMTKIVGKYLEIQSSSVSGFLQDRLKVSTFISLLFVGDGYACSFLLTVSNLSLATSITKHKHYKTMLPPCMLTLSVPGITKSKKLLVKHISSCSQNWWTNQNGFPGHVTTQFNQRTC